MKTEVKEIYKCEFCNKLYQVKNACIKHEKNCHQNPENDRECFHCECLEYKETFVEWENSFNYEPYKRKINLLYCRQKKCFVYPPKVERKGNAFSLDESNIPMPKKCEMNKDYFFK